MQFSSYIMPNKCPHKLKTRPKLVLVTMVAGSLQLSGCTSCTDHNYTANSDSEVFIGEENIIEYAKAEKTGLKFKKAVIYKTRTLAFTKNGLVTATTTFKLPNITSQQPKATVNVELNNVTLPLEVTKRADSYLLKFTLSPEAHEAFGSPDELKIYAGHDALCAKKSSDNRSYHKLNCKIDGTEDGDEFIKENTAATAPQLIFWGKNAIIRKERGISLYPSSANKIVLHDTKNIFNNNDVVFRYKLTKAGKTDAVAIGTSTCQKGEDFCVESGLGFTTKPSSNSDDGHISINLPNNASLEKDLPYIFSAEIKHGGLTYTKSTVLIDPSTPKAKLALVPNQSSTIKTTNKIQLDTNGSAIPVGYEVEFWVDNNGKKERVANTNVQKSASKPNIFVISKYKSSFKSIEMRLIPLKQGGNATVSNIIKL